MTSEEEKAYEDALDGSDWTVPPVSERELVVRLILRQATLEHERAAAGGDETWQIVFQQVGDALARVARRIKTGEHMAAPSESVEP